MSSKPEAGVRSRFFAALWKRLAPGVDEKFTEHKDEVLVDLPNRIIELGPGLGANFRRYPNGAIVVAFEPNAAMHEGLQAEADAIGIDLQIQAKDFRSAGLDAESEDVVVSTLVLCSVGDQTAMINEIKRVLKPGGRFLFVEHVASDHRTVHAFQRAIRRPWSAFGDGCNPAAPTDTALLNAGFSSLETQSGRMGPVFEPTHPIYWGVATK